MGFLLPTVPDQVNEGPRLDSLKIQDSGYGRPIAIMYGQARLSGNIIWATDLSEESLSETDTLEGKKKGKGDVNILTTTFLYFANFAVAFGEGEIGDVLNIWADGKLILSKIHNIIEFNGTLRYRFYTGAEDQLPDPLIEIDTEERTPAYRGLTYIVFERFPLIQFGNRIPAITAEFTQVRQPYSVVLTAESEDAYDSGFVYDGVNRFIYANNGSVQLNDILVDVLDAKTLEKINKLVTSDFTGTQGSEGTDHETSRVIGIDKVSRNAVAVGKGGRRIFNEGFLSERTLDTYWIAVRTPTGNSALVVGPDAPLGYVNALKAIPLSQSAVITQTYISGFERVYIVAWHFVEFFGWIGPRPPEYRNFDDRYVAYQPFELGKPYEVDNAPWSEHILPISIGSAFVYGWIIHNTIYIQVLTPRIDSFDYLDLVTISPSDIVTNGNAFIHTLGGTQDGYLLLYDVITNSIFITVNIDNIVYMVRFNISTKLVEWATPYDGRLLVYGSSVYNFSPQDNYILTGTNIVIRATNFGFNEELFIFDIATGVMELLATGIDFESGGYATYSWWDGIQNAYYEQTQSSLKLRRYEVRSEGQGTTLQTIITDICKRCGLTTNQIDVTGINIDIPGYSITSKSTGKALLKQMLEVLNISVYCTDNKLVFRSKNYEFGALTQGKQTFNIDDFVLKNEDLPYTYIKIEESKLPSILRVKALNIAKNYNETSVEIKRIRAPHSTMRSTNIADYELNYSATQTDIKRIADQLMYYSWLERYELEFGVGLDILQFTPGDIFTLDLNNIFITRIRISKLEIGANWEVNINCVSESVPIYRIPTSVLDGEYIFPPLSIEDMTSEILPDSVVIGDDTEAEDPKDTFIPQSEVIVLDIPALRDQDQTPTPTFLWGATPITTGAWIGTILEMSKTRSSFSAISATTSSIKMG